MELRNNCTVAVWANGASALSEDRDLASTAADDLEAPASRKLPTYGVGTVARRLVGARRGMGSCAKGFPMAGWLQIDGGNR